MYELLSRQHSLRCKSEKVSKTHTPSATSTCNPVDDYPGTLPDKISHLDQNRVLVITALKKARMKKIIKVLAQSTATSMSMRHRSKRSILEWLRHAWTLPTLVILRRTMSPQAWSRTKPWTCPHIPKI